MHSLDKGILPTRKKMENPVPILCYAKRLTTSNKPRKDQWNKTKAQNVP